MYAKVYCVGRDKKNYGLSFPLEIVKTEELQEDNSKRSSSRRTWGTKPPEAGPQRAGLEKSRNICFENIAKNKSWLNKGSETPCKPLSEAFVMTEEALEAKGMSAILANCQLWCIIPNQGKLFLHFTE